MNDAAARDTATRAASRFHTIRRTGAAASRSRDRSTNAWNVATTGARDWSAANIAEDGASGSCACTTSGSKERNALRMRAIDPGLKQIGATVPW